MPVIPVALGNTYNTKTKVITSSQGVTIDPSAGQFYTIAYNQAKVGPTLGALTHNTEIDNKKKLIELDRYAPRYVMAGQPTHATASAVPNSENSVLGQVKF